MGRKDIMKDLDFWIGHLDVMVFIILFYPLAVEYLKWRLEL